MLIALIGAPCAGKHEVARYLIIHHGFQPVFIRPRQTTAAATVADATSAAPRAPALATLHPPVDSASLLQLLPGLTISPPCEEARPNASSSSLSAPPPPPSTAYAMSSRRHTFSSPSELLDYATARWREPLVTLDLRTPQDVDVGFDKRPFFLLVAVEAPTGVRWRRHVAQSLRRRGSSSHLHQHDEHAPAASVDHQVGSGEDEGPAPRRLEEFVARDDAILYGHVHDWLELTRDGSQGDGARTTSSAKPTNRAAPTPPSQVEPTTTANGLVHGSEQGSAHERVGHDHDLGASTASASISTSSAAITAAAAAAHAAPAAAAASPLSSLLATAGVTINNAHATLPALHAQLASMQPPLTSELRLRPSWDLYFLSLCTLASRRSNCMKRRVGAVLVRDHRVLSTGYNGTPRGLLNCNEGGCARCNSAAVGGTMLDECLCLHAEENALLECGRERGGAEGTVLYCNTCPCLRCATKIVQTGVREVVYQLAYSMDGRSRDIFRRANVKFRRIAVGAGAGGQAGVGAEREPGEVEVGRAEAVGLTTSPAASAA